MGCRYVAYRMQKGTDTGMVSVPYILHLTAENVLFKFSRIKEQVRIV
mgnify:FL=1